MAETKTESSDYVVALSILVAALLISATVFFTAMNIKDEIEGLPAIGGSYSSLPSGNAAPLSGGSGNPAAPPAAGSLAGKEVVIDFLYADWCPHCTKMKPILQKLEKELPADRFEARYYNEKDRGANASVKAVYDRYSAAGYFEGYPTFVANGNDYIAGERSEDDFRTWICSHFGAPKPSGC